MVIKKLGGGGGDQGTGGDVVIKVLGGGGGDHGSGGDPRN